MNRRSSRRENAALDLQKTISKARADNKDKPHRKFSIFNQNLNHRWADTNENGLLNRYISNDNIGYIGSLNPGTDLFMNSYSKYQLLILYSHFES